jgi:hypothetical protein
MVTVAANCESNSLGIDFRPAVAAFSEDVSHSVLLILKMESDGKKTGLKAICSRVLMP